MVETAFAVDEVLLVQAGEPPREHYDLLHLVLVAEGENIAVNLIPIGRTADSKLLVALPKAAWNHRRVGRLLPKGGLQRAELVEVSAALSDNPEEEIEEEPIALWVGLLDKKLEKKLAFGEAEDPKADVRVFLEGGEGCHVPFGPSLAAICEDRFTFVSAQSQGEEAESVESRVNKLEEMLVKMQSSLDQVLPKPQRPSALKSKAKTKPSPAARGAIPGELEEAATNAALGTMDPTVVSSALQAGIPREQLEKLAGLLKKTSRMKDADGRVAPKSRGILDETDEEESEAEEDPAEEEAAVGATGAVEQALVKLTKIAEELTGSKKKQKELESLLDLAEGSGESSSSGGWSKSKAAAYKKLRDALEKQPKLISKSIEDAMELDFSQMKKGPGSSTLKLSSRGWLEHRSKLQYYPNTIRQGWILAGIHDAMRQGRWEEAKARTLLGLAALDQSSLDSGNWTLAQEVLLEAAPPFSSFLGRKMPERARGAADPSIPVPPGGDLPKPKPKPKPRPAKGGAKGGSEAEPMAP